METLTSKDGTPIAFERTGSGPPLVLVHGTTGTGKRWAPVVPLLSQRFTLHCVDRVGRGESGEHPSYSFEREFEDLAAVMDSIGEPVSLLGHSFGAICSLEASLRTNRICKLVLYEPPMPTPGVEIFPPGSIERMQELLDAGDREAVLTVFFREVNGMPPTEFDKFRASPMWPARVALAHTLPREMRAVEGYRFEPQRFAAMNVPTLLLLGSDSPPYFGAAIRAIEQALPDARTRVLPGQRHVAMDTAPQLFADEVLRFLGD
jgi:pimeloyl-ACP methyl ester carboxylesterase